MQPKPLGYLGEKLAAQYLKTKGFDLIASNFTIKGGEIDIIARDAKTLVFVEVKTRTGDSFGTGEESVSGLKKYRLLRTIQKYLDKNYSAADPDYRIDIIEVELNPATCSLKKISHFEDIEF